MKISLTQLALALSDPLRVQILDLLAAGRTPCCASPDHPELPRALCATDVQQRLGAITPSKLSYHLKILRDAELIQERRQGKWIYYELNRPTLCYFSQLLYQRYLAPSPHTSLSQIVVDNTIINEH